MPQVDGRFFFCAVIRPSVAAEGPIFKEILRERLSLTRDGAEVLFMALVVQILHMWA
jgi:hypothetical protein